jgi:arylsulfatase A-like enzyme
VGNLELPDIVVVVMDCVQSHEFEAALDSGSGALSGLRAESMVFPKAASVAPWTLPSHASLFSGLYPWEHGCHGKGLLQLPPQVARLPQWLKALGYRTYSASGNPIIGASYGLLNGFDRAAWGEWWERVYRVLDVPPNLYDGSRDPPTNGGSHDLQRRVGRTVALAGQRAPFTLALSDALLRQMKRSDPDLFASMNPWIEPTLERWLEASSDIAPIFCFVNFIDAHEPYLDPGAGPRGERRWWKSLRIPQDSLALLAGESRLTAEDSDLLRNMYRRSVRRLARRVEQLVRRLQKRGRWRDTLFLLTSDHGQAFGEGGVVWHGLRADEAELRVPLWLKLPGDNAPAREGVGWASPLDVAATVLRATGQSRPELRHSVPLQDLVDRERPEPLLSASDGVTWNEPLCARLTPARLAELDRIFGVAYLGNGKVVTEVASGATQAYDVTQDPECRNDLWPTHRARFEPLAEHARAAGEALLRSPTPARTAVEERLHTWGYL